MRLWFVTAMLLVSPTFVCAQSEDLPGKRIRAKLAGPEGPWVIGVATEAYGDSMTMQLLDKRTAVRFRTADVSVERADGYQGGRGFARGAVIGGLAALALSVSALDGEGAGLEALFVILAVPAGAAVGGAIGFGAAPQRWTPVSTGSLPCGGWRMMDGSVRSTPLVTRGPRDRRRGAIIGGAILGGIGLVGGLTDSELPPGDVPGVVAGNFVIGVLVGSLFGPREKVVVPAGCP